MSTPTLTATLAVAALVVTAAACGDDTTEPAGTLPGVPITDITAPPATDPPATDPPATDPPASDPPASDAYEHPTGADEVVFEYAELGGFTTPEFIFQATPNLLVSGDGRIFQPGVQIAIYPGPLVPPIEVASVTEAGIQQLLAGADAAGLLAQVDYTIDSNVADATTATVTIRADGETWLHEAYALGIGGPGAGGGTTPEREALADFLASVQRGDVIDDAEIGESEIFQPEQYFIRANVVDDPAAFTGDDLEPTIVDWPADAPVRLADAEQCAAVDAADVGSLFADANQLTFFRDGDVTYQVIVKPALPGVSCDR